MFYIGAKSKLPLYLIVQPNVYFPGGLLMQSRFYSHLSSSLFTSSIIAEDVSASRNKSFFPGFWKFYVLYIYAIYIYMALYIYISILCLSLTKIQ